MEQLLMSYGRYNACPGSEQRQGKKQIEWWLSVSAYDALADMTSRNKHWPTNSRTSRCCRPHTQCQNAKTDCEAGQLLCSQAISPPQPEPLYANAGTGAVCEAGNSSVACFRPNQAKPHFTTAQHSIAVMCGGV